MSPDELHIARMVLGYFGDPAGYEPGGFTQLLMQAYQKADPGNRYRLRLGFPVMADMMDACLNTATGLQDLKTRLEVAK